MNPTNSILSSQTVAQATIILIIGTLLSRVLGFVREKLIPLMILRNALTGKELPVYGEGKQVRNWVYVEDNCWGLDAVFHRGRVGEVYNIGGDCEKRNIEVVKLICSILEKKLKQFPGLKTPDSRLDELIEFIADPRGAAHDFRDAIDCAKIKEELGWDPECNFEEGLDWMIKVVDS